MDHGEDHDRHIALFNAQTKSHNDIVQVQNRRDRKNHNAVPLQIHRRRLLPVLCDQHDGAGEVEDQGDQLIPELECIVVGVDGLDQKNRRGNQRNDQQNSGNEGVADADPFFLFLLVKETDFPSISITDIIRKAGVSRSAYYRNYSSKEDILTNIFNRAAETIVNALSIELVTQNMVNSYRVLFEKVQEIRPLFEIIQMAGLIDKFQMAVNEKYLQAIDVNSAVEYYRVLSWIGSIFNIIFGWMQRGNQETPEQMAHICSQFLSEEEWRIGTGIKWSTDASC